VTGIVLILLVLYFPKGVLGTVRDKWLPWLP
jgi:branched-chain amino acid transport system permease protein